MQREVVFVAWINLPTQESIKYHSILRKFAMRPNFITQTGENMLNVYRYM